MDKTKEPNTKDSEDSDFKEDGRTELENAFYQLVESNKNEDVEMALRIYHYLITSEGLTSNDLSKLNP